MSLKTWCHLSVGLLNGSGVDHVSEVVMSSSVNSEVSDHMWVYHLDQLSLLPLIGQEMSTCKRTVAVLCN